MSGTAVSVSGLHYDYPDGTPGLRDVSFSVRSGDSLGIIGPNGAGKSTLILHLNGLLSGRGEVRVYGKVPGPKTIQEIRSRVGVVFQDPNDMLFMPTLLDDIAFGPLNMGLPAAEARGRARRLLDALGLLGKDDRPPLRLSLGERKKAALAAVLAMEPDVLVFDEPTAGLDPGTRRAFLELLRGLASTKIIATHDLDLAWRTCPRVLLLDEGTVVTEGPAAEILTDGPLLEAHGLEVPAALVHGRPGPDGCLDPGEA
jgi:energy-coupling factor transporter ATP-binding protein EcfA2